MNATTLRQLLDDAANKTITVEGRKALDAEQARRRREEQTYVDRMEAIECRRVGI